MLFVIEHRGTSEDWVAHLCDVDIGSSGHREWMTYLESGRDRSGGDIKMHKDRYSRIR